MSIMKTGNLTLLDALLMARYVLGGFVDGQTIEDLPKPTMDCVHTLPKLSIESFKSATQTSFSIHKTDQSLRTTITLTVEFKFL